MVRNAVRALFLVAAVTAAAKTPERPVEKPAVTLDSLEAEGNFEVKLEGEKLETFFSKKKAVYFEWTYGVRQGADWNLRWNGYHSEAPLVVQTPKGRLELRPSQLRTYLAPSFERTWTQKDAQEAPEVIKEKLAEEASITAAEYCLEPGRTYFARPHVDSFMLPPRPGQDRPSRGRNTVLWISDKPFGEDGKPAQPLTPAFQGWSY